MSVVQRNNKKQPKRNKSQMKRQPRSKFAPATSRSSTVTRTRIAPDELDIRLMFRKTDQLTNGLGGVVAKSFHTNSAYDVDPSVGSTETLGFDEYAQMYSYYRVISYSYECTVINPGDRPIMFSVINSNTDATTAGTNYTLYSTNPHCQSKLVSTIGSPNIHTFRKSIKISTMLGSPAPEIADSFRSLTSGNPSDLTWFTIAGENIGGSDITFYYDFKLIMSVRFYGREVDLTLAASYARLQKLIESRESLNLAKIQKQKELERKESAKKLPKASSSQ